jgi:anti-anti-sigma factor
MTEVPNALSELSKLRADAEDAAPGGRDRALSPVPGESEEGGRVVRLGRASRTARGSGRPQPTSLRAHRDKRRGPRGRAIVALSDRSGAELPPSVILLCGALDETTAPVLAAAVASRCLHGALEVRLDLGEVSAIDCAGLEALRAARRMCESRDRRFSLECPVGRIGQAVEQAGLGRYVRRRVPALELVASDGHDGSRQPAAVRRLDRAGSVPRVRGKGLDGS